MPRGRDPSIERTTEYEEFIGKLRAYHERRGTTLDPEPRIGNKHVDLLRLFKAVVAKGGYDVVCTEKLGWRTLGIDFGLDKGNLLTLAFSMKSAYYKNLAAYEISTVHGKEPPPREILEDISARGGDLLNRTLENFKSNVQRVPSTPVNGDESDGGEEVRGTPEHERAELEDPGSGGRFTRGLRQAPPQRVLFQPDVSSSRQTRHASANTSSPQPTAQQPVTTYNNSANPGSMSFTVANYEPRPQMPLTLRPVVTPGNNPNLFKERQRATREAKAAKEGRTGSNYKGMMLPGTGFEGPNIYVRTLQALRSGIPEEQDYALYHLVKISHERGDKFKFDAFPGLAEGLIEKALEISSLFYDVHWQISFNDDGTMYDDHTLDGMNGTADILQRIQSLTQLETVDDMETEQFSQRLIKINEASLVLRNMAMLEENAEYLSRMYPIRDFISIALNLPKRPTVVEIQHYALDIAEQLTKHYSLGPEDPLYLSLLAQLDSTDRGAILTSLRAISRISMNLEESNRLGGVPAETLERIYQWTLVDDEELVHACLDFLYQFTALVSNIEVMLAQMNVEALINQLVRLLLYNAKEMEHRRMTKAPVKNKGATEVPSIPKSLLEELLTYDEPERSAHWLRACFEEDAESDITQIALWQAYQSRFIEHQTPNRSLLPAAEFIKNISTTFGSASAQVVQGPNPKFIIKGIRPRHSPMSPEGQVYLRCPWRVGPGQECGEHCLAGKELWEHALSDHLHVPRRADGKFDSNAQTGKVYHCHWGACHRYGSEGTSSAHAIGMHLQTHIPDKNPPARGSNAAQDAEYQTQVFYNTAVDERGDAAGLPLTAALVLRNLARHLPKVETPLEGDQSWTKKLFGSVEPRLWYVMAHNRPLAGYMADLTATISAGY